MAIVYQSNSGIIDVKSYAKLYDKTIDEVIAKSEKVVREGRQLVAERTTNLDTYTEAEVFSQLAMPNKNEDTDRIPLLNPVEGFKQTWTNVQYRSGIMVTERAVLAQKNAQIAKMIQGLPDSTVEKEERLIASLFNGGFATETTPDGAYLFSATHYKSDPEAGTFRNLAASAGAVTTTSFFTAWQAFQNFTSEKGNPAPQEVTKIVYPVAAYEAVMQLLNSDKYPQNSTNAASPFYKAATPFLYHRLTSTTAWFVQGSAAEMDQGFLLVWQTKPKYDTLSDGMNPQLIMGKSVVMRLSVGALHARTWYGNAGA